MISLKDVFVIHTFFPSFPVCAQNPEIVDEIWPEVQPVGRTGRLNCTVARLNENTVSVSLCNEPSGTSCTVYLFVAMAKLLHSAFTDKSSLAASTLCGC